MSSGDLFSRNYSSFRGVDFRGEEINLMRSPDSLNVWKDYKETESIRTRPEMKLLLSFDETIYGVFFYTARSIENITDEETGISTEKVTETEMMLVHSGKKLYKVIGDEKTLIYGGLNTQRSNAFVFNNNWFFKDGSVYLQFDGEEIDYVKGYIPTTSIGRKPSGGGTINEDINMLTSWRKNTFVGDGASTEFFLDGTYIPVFLNPFNPSILTVEIDGETYKLGNKDEKYIVSLGTNPNGIRYSSVIITPAPPESHGQDNVSIKFLSSLSSNSNIIDKCTLLEVFDNRVFFSGNPDYPNRIWHCSLDYPTYCSDLDYYDEGIDTAAVKDMVAGNNVLWVFKEPSQANTTIFYHVPTIDSEYGKIYPNTHSSISAGCIGKAINFNDDIVFFSERGMEGISGDITTEQAISHRSSLVDRKLTVEPDYSDMILEEWEGYLTVIIDNKVYLADSRAVFANENHYEYEWFYWEFPKKITCAKVNKGILYLGTEDGVYTLTDTESNVESYWVTPKDKFSHPHYLKTTNKRGCVVEATGDISLYAKTEKTDFELIGTYENITDYFVSRIKRKKFKDIQLKFHSKTRFSLETATLECFIGGYIKR